MSPVAGSGRASSQAKVKIKLKKDNSERWLLTYSDLITLLLAFFIVMYGISSADAQKFTKLASSMKKAFNVGVLEGSPSNSILEQTSRLSINEESGMAFDAGLGATELDVIFSEMGWIFQEEGIQDKVDIEVRSEGIAISLSGNLLFTSGRSDLRPESVKLLSSIAKALARLPNQIRVEGHTDDIPPIGSDYPTNWELSGARAIAVVRFFSEIENIDPSRLSAVAFSQYQPVTPNNSPQGRARNRRSEILIMYPPSASSSPQATMTVPGEIIEKESNSADTTR